MRARQHHVTPSRRDNAPDQGDGRCIQRARARESVVATRPPTTTARTSTTNRRRLARLCGRALQLRALMLDRVVEQPVVAGVDVAVVVDVTVRVAVSAWDPDVVIEHAEVAG